MEPRYFLFVERLNLLFAIYDEVHKHITCIPEMPFSGNYASLPYTEENLSLSSSSNYLEENMILSEHGCLILVVLAYPTAQLSSVVSHRSTTQAHTSLSSTIRQEHSAMVVCLVSTPFNSEIVLSSHSLKAKSIAQHTSQFRAGIPKIFFAHFLGFN